MTVPSPYSNNHLPLVASTEGKVYVDYSIDLNLFLQRKSFNTNARGRYSNAI